jgi:hypothetical protein
MEGINSTDASRQTSVVSLIGRHESLEAAGTILDAVWRKVRRFPDPAASTT